MILCALLVIATVPGGACLRETLSASASCRRSRSRSFICRCGRQIGMSLADVLHGAQLVERVGYIGQLIEGTVAESLAVWHDHLATGWLICSGTEFHDIIMCKAHVTTPSD